MYIYMNEYLKCHIPTIFFLQAHVDHICVDMQRKKTDQTFFLSRLLMRDQNMGML
jgi:hypothetical protein